MYSVFPMQKPTWELKTWLSVHMEMVLRTRLMTSRTQTEDCQLKYLLQITCGDGSLFKESFFTMETKKALCLTNGPK